MLALALKDFSQKFEGHEILIEYTGGFDASKAEYCSARPYMFYRSILGSTQGEREKDGEMKTLKSWLGVQNSEECYTGRMQLCSFADPKLPGE